MSLNTNAIMDALASHAAATGYFDRVNKHEPKSAPGNGLSCSITWASTTPAPARSGLSVTSARVTFAVRVGYVSMLAEPQDDIDPNIADATDGLFAAYIGDFDLKSTASNIDIFGASGIGLNARTGYIDIGSMKYRVADITVPVIVNDVWSQAA